MFVSDKTMKLLLESGLPAEQLVAILQSLRDDEAASRPVEKTPRQERNARYYDNRRERLKSSETHLKASETSENAESVLVPPLSLSPSPQTPQPHTHTPPDITTRARKAAKRCPEDWSPTPADIAAGEKEGFQPDEIEREYAKFRDHTFGTARSDWSATFRNWLRTAAERKPRKPNDQRNPDQKLVARHENYAAAFRGAELASAIRRVGE